VGDAERSAWPAARRPRLFNLLVTLSTHPARAKLAQVVDKLRNVATAEAAAAQAEEEATGQPSLPGGLAEPLLPGADTALVHNANKWRPFLPPDCGRKKANKGKRADEGCSVGAASRAPGDTSRSGATPAAAVANFSGAHLGRNLPAEAYRRALLESIFTLCPAGHAPETFRLFEAAEAGSIPIVDYISGPERTGSSGSTRPGGGGLLEGGAFAVRDRRRRLKAKAAATATGQCEDPMRPFRDSNAPFLWVANWEVDLAPLLARLRRVPQEVLARQNALAAW
jgi:hypothetical protein